MSTSSAPVQWSLMGNHDFAVLYEPTNFKPGRGIRRVLDASGFDAKPDDHLPHRRQFLGKLRAGDGTRRGGMPILAVHGSPQTDQRYIFATDPRMYPDEILSVFGERVDPLPGDRAGHTRPGRFHPTSRTSIRPTELGENRFVLRSTEDEKGRDQRRLSGPAAGRQSPPAT